MKSIRGISAAGSNGFTLIELLIVIIIIAILAAIVIPTYLESRTKSQDSAAVSLVRNALTIIESAHIEQHDYQLITESDLQAIEPDVVWAIRNVDLVDPDIPTVTAAVNSRATDRGVDYYAQSSNSFDVASLSASGNRYGIQVQLNGLGGASYVKVRVADGESSLVW